MTKSASLSVAHLVCELAKVHHVTADRDGMSRMAVAITRLADDNVELDVIEQLLVNLKKKGILTKAETLEMKGDYLREKRQIKQNFSA